MKKNKIFSLLAAASLLITVPSCTNLDERVFDKLPAESFGSTDVEVNALVGTCYNSLKRLTSDIFNTSEASGSSMIHPTRIGGDWYDGGQYEQLFMHTYSSQTQALRNSWNHAMEAIGTCNANIKVVEASTMADAAQKAAEIRGIRAYWYYILCDFFGNVPMVIDYDDKELPTNSTRQQVFDFIISEINSIIPSLPESSHDNYGRFTKGAGYTLLAKMYLNAEAWGVSASNAYNEVIKNCENVYQGDYILEPVWKDNFKVDNETSKEAIFSAQYKNTDTSLTRNQHFRTLGYVDNKALNIKASGWNGYCAQPDYVKLFADDDPRKEGSYIIGIMYDLTVTPSVPLLTEKGNYIMDHSIEVYPLDGTEYDNCEWRAVNQHDGARMGKWDFEVGLSSAMENDYHIFRLADVYLMEAEAILRGGSGNSHPAEWFVNQVRDRAYPGHSYGSVTLADVQLERRLELAWENSSRQDDIRFGCYDKDMWSMFRANVSHEVDSTTGFPKSIDGNKYNWNRPSDKYLELFPIPLSAWQTNPNLVQNPGYPAFN